MAEVQYCTQKVAGLVLIILWRSREIKNAIKYGYKFEIINRYLFESDYLFRDYIGELFNMKLNSQKGTPMYLISKLLMNSL